MSLCEPYYEDGTVTIYHGDCREILPLVDADVMVTDPPYGIGWRQNGGGVSGKTRGSRRHLGIAGDGDTTVRDAVLAEWVGPALVFGSFRAPFPAAVKQTLVFRKSADAGLMGSGSTLRAAKDLGRKAIGIEVEERYCEIAAKRMGQEVLDLGLAA